MLLELLQKPGRKAVAMMPRISSPKKNNDAQDIIEKEGKSWMVFRFVCFFFFGGRSCVIMVFSFFFFFLVLSKQR